MSTRTRYIAGLIAIGLSAGLEAVARELQIQLSGTRPAQRETSARPGYVAPEF